MNYRFTLEGLTYDEAKQLFAAATSNDPGELHGNVGMSWFASVKLGSVPLDRISVKIEAMPSPREIQGGSW